MVRELRGLEVIYYVALASKIEPAEGANLERTIFFLKEAARAGAIDLEDAQHTGRLVYRMIVRTTEAILNGDEDEAACATCGHFIVAGLNARALPRTDEFWPAL
jgi:hypothetical protein